MGTHSQRLTAEDRALLVRTVEEAGRIIAGYFGKPLEKNIKSVAADYSTRADYESENYIVSVLRKHFPDIGVIGEENGETNGTNGYQFVLDPLDGTHTFSIGFPVFSISLALLHENEILFSIVHEPIPQFTYIAVKGEGTTRNGERMSVNKNIHLTHAVIAYSQGWKVPERSPKILTHRIQNALDPYERSINMWSTAAELARVATGQIDAVICNQNEIYDVAGGMLLIREAGGRITDLNGKELISDRHEIFLASNGTALHDEILRRIRGIITA